MTQEEAEHLYSVSQYGKHFKKYFFPIGKLQSATAGPKFSRKVAIKIHLQKYIKRKPSISTQANSTLCSLLLATPTKLLSPPKEVERTIRIILLIHINTERAHGTFLFQQQLIPFYCCGEKVKARSGQPDTMVCFPNSFLQTVLISLRDYLCTNEMFISKTLRTEKKHALLQW